MDADASGRVMWVLLVIFSLLLSHPEVSADEKVNPRIGIVGGGIGGTSAAYFLRQLYGDAATIDLYEKKNIGGRLATVVIGDGEYEAGGGIIHPKNFYMLNFTKILGLEPVVQNDGILGIFDGEKMRVTTSSYSLVSLAKLFWRYGMDIYNIQSWISDVLMEKFKKIYDIQNAGFAYTSVLDLVGAMDHSFVQYMKKSIKEVLKKEGYGERFIDEMVLGAMRTNYGQNTDIHGFVGAVSLAGVEDGLWSVKGGNRRVPEELVKHAKVNVIQGEVKSISLLEYQDENYELRYLPNNGGEVKHKGYDMLFIATPMHEGVSDIKFDDFPTDIHNFPQKFHRTVATFVSGLPNNTHYGYENLDNFPSNIFTCKPELFLNSYGKQSDINENSGQTEKKSIEKIFTNSPPSEKDIEKYFKTVDDIRMVDWLAYPEYSLNVDALPPFVLHDNMYYINAIEMAASAMEMSVIGARNVALLSYNHWHGKLEYIDEPYVDPSKTSEKAEL